VTSHAVNVPRGSRVVHQPSDDADPRLTGWRGCTLQAATPSSSGSTAPGSCSSALPPRSGRRGDVPGRARDRRDRLTGVWQPPGEATVRRVLARVDPDALDRAIGAWLGGQHPARPRRPQRRRRAAPQRPRRHPSPAASSHHQPVNRRPRTREALTTPSHGRLVTTIGRPRTRQHPDPAKPHAEPPDPRLGGSGLGYGVSQRTQGGWMVVRRPRSLRDHGADQRWLPGLTAATATLPIRSAG
jgi:hypothetical protein